VVASRARRCFNGNMINDEEGYRYTYSPWCKLVKVRWGVSPVTVAEYSYTATGRRVTERYDMNQNNQLDTTEPTTVIATDLAGRRVATFLLKGSSGGPFDAKETFFHHPPEIGGPGFKGGPIVRDRNAALVDPDEWGQPADPDRLERRYYATDWQGRVVSMVTAAGELAESYRYTANGVPIGIPLGDVNGDGKVENGATDEDWQQAYWWENNFGAYDARLDLNLDGSVNATDIGLVGSQTPGSMPTARASAASVGNRMFGSARVEREAVLGREGDYRALLRFSGTCLAVAFMSDEPELPLIDQCGDPKLVRGAPFRQLFPKAVVDRTSIVSSPSNGQNGFSTQRVLAKEMEAQWRDDSVTVVGKGESYNRRWLGTEYPRESDKDTRTTNKCTWNIVCLNTAGVCRPELSTSKFGIVNTRCAPDERNAESHMANWKSVQVTGCALEYSRPVEDRLNVIAKSRSTWHSTSGSAGGLSSISISVMGTGFGVTWTAVGSEVDLDSTWLQTTEVAYYCKPRSSGQ